MCALAPPLPTTKLSFTSTTRTQSLPATYGPTQTPPVQFSTSLLQEEQDGHSTHRTHAYARDKSHRVVTQA